MILVLMLALFFESIFYCLIIFLLKTTREVHSNRK